jgi:mannose-6-phosphate isomerase-like protein (cupin superfamily)
MKYVFSEPAEPAFDKIGHTGKIFGAKSGFTNHLVIETEEGISKSLIEHKSEFNYYVIDGTGEFVIAGDRYPCHPGDLIVIPPGTVFTFNGKLKLLLINTPGFSPEQEEELPKEAADER